MKLRLRLQIIIWGDALIAYNNNIWKREKYWTSTISKIRAYCLGGIITICPRTEGFTAMFCYYTPDNFKLPGNLWGTTLNASNQATSTTLSSSIKTKCSVSVAGRKKWAGMSLIAKNIWGQKWWIKRQNWWWRGFNRSVNHSMNPSSSTSLFKKRRQPNILRMPYWPNAVKIILSSSVHFTAHSWRMRFLSVRESTISARCSSRWIGWQIVYISLSTKLPFCTPHWQSPATTELSCPRIRRVGRTKVLTASFDITTVHLRPIS